MKGKLERVPQRIGVSWRYQKIVEEAKKIDWHRHLEYEIAIHRHFSGTCFIGHHETVVNHNHMIMIGPGLPHAVYSHHNRDSSVCETHVVWFRKEWIDQLVGTCNELQPLKVILEDSNRGLTFSPDTAEKVVGILDTVLDLPPHRQISQLILVFALLIEDTKPRKLLNPRPSCALDAESTNQDKLEKAERFMQSHFAEPITLADLASHLYTSESSVRRLFQSHFKESFSQYLKKVRLSVACNLLINTDLPIRIVMEKVGYENQANFNRQFKDYKGSTPTEYRSEIHARR